MNERELTNDLANWSKKSQVSKGGVVNHTVSCPDIKKACGCAMGDLSCKHPYEAVRGRD